jgi:dTDP-3-amino-3,4,6-trideoxy-alpha-D-glucose transaminase
LRLSRRTPFDAHKCTARAAAARADFTAIARRAPAVHGDQRDIRIRDPALLGSGIRLAYRGIGRPTLVTPEIILLNDFKRQWAETRSDVLAAVERVGASGWYVLGPSVASFEEALAIRMQRRFAVGCASGLDAIEIGLRALALPAGAHVLTTPLSAFATTLAIVRAGCVPVFADVDPIGHLDLDLCAQLLAERSDIRVMVPVHLYGQAMDLDALADVKRRFHLRIVEDCAQSIDARFAGRAAGTIGDLAATSFYPTKNLGALGDGGAVLTDDETLRAAANALRNYGQSARYQHDRLGLNSRLDELHAAILQTAVLPRLTAWTARRRQVAAAYLAGIRHTGVHLPAPAQAAEPVWHLFPVLVAPAERDSFQAHLRAAGIESAVHYPRLIPEQNALADVAFEVVGDLHRAKRFAAGEVSLPIHPHLSDSDVERIITAVNAWKAS